MTSDSSMFCQLACYLKLRVPRHYYSTVLFGLISSPPIHTQEITFLTDCWYSFSFHIPQTDYGSTKMSFPPKIIWLRVRIFPRVCMQHA